METLYAVSIRQSDNSLGVLEYQSEIKHGSDIQHNDYKLYDHERMLIGHKYWSYDPSSDAGKPGMDDIDTMPDWFKLPSLDAHQKWIKAYKPENGPLPATNNVVTFAIYRQNGAMMGQFRSFVSPAGKPIGNPGMPSMHGGMIEDGDFPVANPSSPTAYECACMVAVMREILEEFGVEVRPGGLNYVGSVYDADNGRHNAIYRVFYPYETLLKYTHDTNVDAIMEAILDCEGIGRFSRMFREDLERAIELKQLTPISIRILEAFPELMPPGNRKGVSH